MTNAPTGPGRESLADLIARNAREMDAAYDACPHAFQSTDYFARFSRDPEAVAGADEVAIAAGWRIALEPNASPLAGLMAGHLQDFLARAMGVPPALTGDAPGTGEILLAETGGGDETPGSFTLEADTRRIAVRGRDAEGLRDGIVRLVALLGLRQAPIVPAGRAVHAPRLRVRLGVVPFHGAYRELVFMGCNAVQVHAGSLYGLSTSDAIPELAARRQPDQLGRLRAAVAEARRYGLRCYAFLDIRQKFAPDDAVFRAHPEIRGPRTWKADGEYILCTEHPLVQRYLQESLSSLFTGDDGLDGAIIIIGGEGFYHCFMHPYGAEKGHTTCPRCEALGPDTVVATLCNGLAAAARRINPRAEILAWPYSAEHIWSSDRPHEGFIRRLRPGTAVFTEVEKDEWLEKPEGVRKHLWDYSIDMTGLGDRAQRQLALCRETGISIFLKSEPELSFEAPRLPSIPCPGRWWDRAEALAGCGADGALVFPAFRPCYGTISAEIYQYAWWSPAPEKMALLAQLAARTAGPAAAAHLLEAWERVSQAIPWSPELPSYYTGPYYLGPAHPMCADPTAPLPPVFSGYFFFWMEITDADGMTASPTYVTSPGGDAEVFGRFYRRMERELHAAVVALAAAGPLVPARCQRNFAAESSSIRWFYHTARAQANFHESCLLRDRLAGEIDAEEARRLLARWHDVLRDEEANAAAALPLMQEDMRLDWHYGSDHSFPHGEAMLRAKLALIADEIAVYLPALAKRRGWER